MTSLLPCRKTLLIDRKHLFQLPYRLVVCAIFVVFLRVLGFMFGADLHVCM